jgi:hypothetical protein
MAWRRTAGADDADGNSLGFEGDAVQGLDWGCFRGTLVGGARISGGRERQGEQGEDDAWR